VTFVELRRYEDIPNVRSAWGMSLKREGSNGLIGSSVSEWELEAIRLNADLQNISDLVGTPFCVNSNFAWDLAINDKAVRSMAERDGGTYITPTDDEFLELIVDSLLTGEKIDLRHITEMDQLELAGRMFIGGFGDRKMRPSLILYIKEQLELKSSGTLTVEVASKEEFKSRNTCLCGSAYLRLVNTQTGETQLFSISELLPIVSLDPGK
jgi:hypothetical protein